MTSGGTAMASPKLNGKHGEMIVEMYGRTEALVSDLSNIKETQKELRKEVSDIHSSITDLKVSTKGYSENLSAVKCELEEHKKEHHQSFGRLMAILGIIATFISIAVSVIFNLFQK